MQTTNSKTCSLCRGKGSVKKSDGKKVVCYQCGGTGRGGYSTK